MTLVSFVNDNDVLEKIQLAGMRQCEHDEPHFY